MNSDGSPDNRELADLLPFYATGRLPAAERARVENALRGDAALRRELVLIQEEQAVVAEASEALGSLSASAANRFQALLEAQPSRKKAAARGIGPVGWLAGVLQALTPRQLAYAGIVAALLVMAQAALIGALWSPGTIYVQASVSSEVGEGTYAVLAFTPEARLADIAKLLDDENARIVDGPRAGGFFIVRIGPKDMPGAQRDKVIAELTAKKGLVRYAAPSQ